jgi:hypothetical protein
MSSFYDARLITLTDKHRKTFFSLLLFELCKKIVKSFQLGYYSSKIFIKFSAFFPHGEIINTFGGVLGA